MTLLSTVADLLDGLKLLNDEFRTLQTVVPSLTVEKYRPRGGEFDPPGIYTVLRPADMEPEDTLIDRDTLIVGVRIGVAHTDVDVEMDQLLALTDQYRPFIDTALKNISGPLRGAEVRRLGFRVVEDTFNQVPVLAIEFPIRAYLEAANVPSY